MDKCKVVKKSRTWLIVFIIFILFFIFLLIRPDFTNKEIKEVVISENMLNKLLLSYNEDTETLYCLSGEVKDKVLTIKDYKFTKQVSDETSVNYVRCNILNTIGLLHTQPKNNCLFSPEDVYYFGRGGLYVNIIICGNTDDDVIAYGVKSPIPIKIIEEVE